MTNKNTIITVANEQSRLVFDKLLTPNQSPQKTGANEQLRLILDKWFETDDLDGILDSLKSAGCDINAQAKEIYLRADGVISVIKAGDGFVFLSPDGEKFTKEITADYFDDTEDYEDFKDALEANLHHEPEADDREMRP